MNDITLTACPFCGSTNVRVFGATAIYAYCLDCGASSGLYGSREDAAKAWNTRDQKGGDIN